MAPRHILLVDDQREVRRIMRASLEMLNRGYAIAEVPSGEEALLELARQRYDLLITDQRLPGLSGLELLGRVRGWVKPDGRLFLHVFSHARYPYRFDTADRTNWIAQHFFTGGIMPSQTLIRQFADLFEVDEEWRWDGTHYERTALDWLALFDARADEIEPVLRGVYGKDTELWMRRWRLFYLATAGLFGNSGGKEWGVSHWRLRPA